MVAKTIGLLAAAASAAGPANAGDISQISGEWRTVRHGAEVRIDDCGNGTPCGVLVSVALAIRGEATTDERNKDPELRTRPLDGLPILWGYQDAEAGWRKGRLYNPETGQTFRSSMELVSPDRLKVRGCLGPLCRSQIWTRIPAPTTTQAEG